MRADALPLANGTAHSEFMKTDIHLQKIGNNSIRDQ